MRKNESPDRVAVEEGIVVGSAGGRDLQVDLFVPPAGKANGIGVLLIHGGAWMTGDRAQLRGYGILLGRVGYTCVASEYRLAPGAKWPAQLEDVRQALDWMRAHAGELGIDKERIVVEGNSAGAHLALMIAATAPSIAACIAIYPPADLKRRHAVARERTRINPVPQLLERIDDESLTSASPITYASASFPPTMLIHGNADEVVPVEQSLLMYDGLIKAGAKAELHIFEGVPHAFDRDPALGRQCAALMQLFIARHVAVPAAAAAAVS
jgi:acetyl esterase/lipase